MAYNLIITGRAVITLNHDLSFLIKIAQAKAKALLLLDELETIYHRIAENPGQFPVCGDEILAEKGIRKAILVKSKYNVLFNVSGSDVYIRAIVSMKQKYTGIL